MAAGVKAKAVPLAWVPLTKADVASHRSHAKKHKTLADTGPFQKSSALESLEGR